MIKRTALRSLGVFTYIGIPLAVSAKYWSLLSTSDGGTTLGISAIFVLMLSLPVLQLLLKDLKIPFKVNYAWFIITAVSGVFMLVSTQIFFIGLGGCVGSLSGSYLFSKASKDKEQEIKDLFAQTVADKLKGEDNV